MRGDWMDEARQYETVDRIALLRAKCALALAEWDKYTRRMRCAEKRKYAEAFGAFRFGDAPNPEPGTLSYMAAQAVRMNAEELYRRVVQP